MLYGAQQKVANIRDTSIQPYQTKTESIEFILPKGVRSADITVDLSYYLGSPDQRYERPQDHQASYSRPVANADMFKVI